MLFLSLCTFAVYKMSKILSVNYVVVFLLQKENKSIEMPFPMQTVAMQYMYHIYMYVQCASNYM